MARAQWSLTHNRPVIEITLSLALGGAKVSRTLLADTGAGNTLSSFELILDENDCLLCAGKASHMIALGGAYAGLYPLYVVRVEIPLLGFTRNASAVGVPNPPASLDGIACFRFLNRFSYGNFGNAGEFGLEV